MLSKVLSLDKLSCPQIWNIEQGKVREKEKGGGRPEKLNEKKKGDRDLEREIKTKETFFCWKNNMKFCSGGDKMRNASGHQCKVKMSGSEKKVNENTYDISSQKRVNKKFLEVSRCSRAKQRQRNVQKKVCCTCKVAFLLIRPIVVFHRSPALPSPLSITRFYILFEQTINVTESFAFSSG